MEYNVACVVSERDSPFGSLFRKVKGVTIGGRGGGTYKTGNTELRK